MCLNWLLFSLIWFLLDCWFGFRLLCVNLLFAGVCWFTWFAIVGCCSFADFDWLSLVCGGCCVFSFRG